MQTKIAPRSNITIHEKDSRLQHTISCIFRVFHDRLSPSARVAACPPRLSPSALVVARSPPPAVHSRCRSLVRPFARPFTRPIVIAPQLSVSLFVRPCILLLVTTRVTTGLLRLTTVYYVLLPFLLPVDICFE